MESNTPPGRMTHPATTAPIKRRPATPAGVILYLLAVALVLLSPLFGRFQILAIAAGAGGAAALAARALGGLRPRHGFLLACVPYLLVVFHFLLTDRLDGDSWRTHFPKFNYICDSLAAGCPFPPWFPSSGGIRLGVFHINFNQTLPNRLVGYLLYLLSPVSVVAAYKLQYVSGVLLMAFGWWLALREIAAARIAAFCGTLMILMGGTGITFHQEHALATASLFPWFAFALLRARRSPAYLFPAAIIFGLGLSAHYPQIQAVSMGLTLAALLAFRVIRLRNLRPARAWHIPLLAALVLLSALPSLYVYHAARDLASRERRSFFMGRDIAGGDSPPIIQVEGRSYAVGRDRSYAAYLRLHRPTFSASPRYFRQYLIPSWGKSPSEPYPADVRDRCSFFVGRVGLLLAALGVILAFRRSLPFLVLLIVFSAFSLGLYGPVPKLLYSIRFPMIHVFRQWVHFFPMVNFSLSALAAIGIDRWLETGGRKPKAAGAVAAAAVFTLAFDLAAYDLRYLKILAEKTVPADRRSTFYLPDTPESRVFQYRDRLLLQQFCPEADSPGEAYLTAGIENLADGEEPDFGELCRTLKREGADVLTGIPARTLSRHFSPGGRAERRPVPSRVEYDGLVVEAELEEPALLVTPLNCGLRPEAFVNGEKTEVFPANRALAAVLLDRGYSLVRFTIPADIYWPLVGVQWLLYLLAAGFFVIRRRD